MPKEATIAAVTGNGLDPSSSGLSTETPEVQAKVEPKIEAEVKPWPTFLQIAKNEDIKDRFAGEIKTILSAHGLEDYCALALFEPEDSIDSYDLDQIFTALSELNPDRSRDVLLLLLSRGGSIEPAYQISKLCKSFTKDRFIAVVPRHAKSAAT
jgi:hypothetical protein